MWTRTFSKTADVESGTSEPLYPTMVAPDLRWSFIRKVYSIVTIQLLLTAVVSAIIVHYQHPIAIFLNSIAGFSCYVLIIIAPIIGDEFCIVRATMLLLLCYYQRHPLNYVLLGIFTIAFAVAVGLSCAFTSRKVILEAIIVTAVVVVSLTLYTFWAAKRGSDFISLRFFAVGASNLIACICIIQIFFPMGGISVMIYAGLSAIVSCCYIVLDTDSLIKELSYDDYIVASVFLYVYIIRLFVALLIIFRKIGDK